MSTLELENIKHPDNSGDNIGLASNGNVGIGTGSPSDRLHIQKSNDTGIIIENTTGATLSLLSTGAGRVRSSGTLIFDTGGATERMRVGSNGYVGVGTSTPLRKLHIADAGDTHIMLQSTNAADNSEIFEIGAGANSASKVDLTFRTRLNSGSGGTEHMRITNDGYVTTPNQVSFYARISGSWSSVDNAAEIVPAAAFNTTPLWNNGNGFSGNRFTAPIAGKYMFIFSAEKANNVGDATYITIHKNGTEITNARIYHASQDHRKTLQYTMIMDLAVNDYAEPYTNSFRSGVAWDNRGQFAGYLIG